MILVWIQSPSVAKGTIEFDPPFIVGNLFNIKVYEIDLITVPIEYKLFDRYSESHEIKIE